MTFGKAIKALKKGKRAARRTWPFGYIYLVPANAYKPTTDVGHEIAAVSHVNDLVPYADYIAYRKPSAPVQMWAPTHADILADDWEVW